MQLDVVITDLIKSEGLFPLRYYQVARGILTWLAQVIDLGWLSLFQVIGSRSSDLGHVLMGLEGGLECSILNTVNQQSGLNIP